MLDERIARVKELIAKREAIDAELGTMLGLQPREEPAKRRCSKCGQEGHTARSCKGEAVSGTE